MENTYANDLKKLKKHLNSVYERFGKVFGLGQRNFMNLRSAVNPSIEEVKKLVQILVDNSRRCEIFLLTQICSRYFCSDN